MCSKKETKNGSSRLSRNSVVHYRYKNFDRKVKLSDCNESFDCSLKGENDDSIRSAVSRRGKENEIEINPYKDDNGLIKKSKKDTNRSDPTINQYCCVVENDELNQNRCNKKKKACACFGEKKREVVKNSHCGNQMNERRRKCGVLNTEPVKLGNKESDKCKTSMEALGRNMQTNTLGCSFEISYRLPEFRNLFSVKKSNNSTCRNDRKHLKCKKEPPAMKSGVCGSCVRKCASQELYAITSTHKKEARKRSAGHSDKNKQTSGKSVHINAGHKEFNILNLPSTNYNVKTTHEQNQINSNQYNLEKIEHQVLKQIQDYTGTFNKTPTEFDNLLKVKRMHYNECNDVYQNYYKALNNPTDVSFASIESNRIDEINKGILNHTDYTYNVNKSLNFDSTNSTQLLDGVPFKNLKYNLKNQAKDFNSVKHELLNLISKIKAIDGESKVRANIPQAIYHTMWSEINTEQAEMVDEIRYSPDPSNVTIKESALNQLMDNVFCKETKKEDGSFGNENCLTTNFPKRAPLLYTESDLCSRLLVFISSVLERLEQLDNKVQTVVSELELLCKEAPDVTPADDLVDENKQENYTLQRDTTNPNLIYIVPPKNSQYKSCDCNGKKPDCLEINITRPLNCEESCDTCNTTYNQFLNDVQLNDDEDEESNVFVALRNYVSCMFTNIMPSVNNDSAFHNCD